MTTEKQLLEQGQKEAIERVLTLEHVFKCENVVTNWDEYRTRPEVIEIHSGFQSEPFLLPGATFDYGFAIGEKWFTAYTYKGMQYLSHEKIHNSLNNGGVCLCRLVKFDFESSFILLLSIDKQAYKNDSALKQVAETNGNIICDPYEISIL